MILEKEMFYLLDDTVNTDINPVTYLSIDPGKSNGVCGYDAKYYPQFFYTINEEDIIEFLEYFKHIKKCIIENYLLFPNKAQSQVYSDMLTSRVIGRVEGWAARKKIEIISQGSSIKATGYKWIGKKPLPKSNPLNHELDAHVHFMYWAVKNKKINAADLLRTSNVLP